MQQQRLGQHLADRHARVERAVGVLEDELGAGADAAQLGARQGGEIAALETDRARGRLHQPEREPADRRLAAARLADQRQRLARRHAEARRRRRRAPRRSACPAASGAPRSAWSRCRGRGAARSYRRSPSPRLPSGHPRRRAIHGLPEGKRGEGRGEGQPQGSTRSDTLALAPVAAPHPNPLPMPEEHGERESARTALMPPAPPAAPSSSARGGSRRRRRAAAPGCGSAHRRTGTGRRSGSR